MAMKLYLDKDHEGKVKSLSIFSIVFMIISFLAMLFCWGLIISALIGNPFTVVDICGLILAGLLTLVYVELIITWIKELKDPI